MVNRLYANAMNCSLLKESVMDFVVENKIEKIQQKIPQGCLRRLIDSHLGSHGKNGQGECKQGH